MIDQAQTQTFLPARDVDELVAQQLGISASCARYWRNISGLPADALVGNRPVFDPDRLDAIAEQVRQARAAVRAAV